jgi:hypothetical protein
MVRNDVDAVGGGVLLTLAQALVSLNHMPVTEHAVHPGHGGRAPLGQRAS